MNVRKTFLIIAITLITLIIVTSIFWKPVMLSLIIIGPILIIGLSLIFQIFLGVFTILSGVKMSYASLHQINSILIILSTLYFLYIVKYKKPNY